MTYQELVDKSVAKMGHPRKYGKDKIKGYNQHHIMPRCMGGNDDGENIVYFTYAEHLMAHILLFRENPNNKSLAFAAFQMSNEIGVDTLLNIVDSQEEFNKCVFDIVIAKETYIEWLSKSMTGGEGLFLGRHHTKESKQKISNANKGHRHSEETKQKIRENIPDKSGENNPMYGRNHSEESRDKMRGKRLSLSGANNPHARAVRCVETGEIFDCINDARNKTGIRHISDVCRGERKTAGGYHWMYYDEYLANEK